MTTFALLAGVALVGQLPFLPLPEDRSSPGGVFVERVALSAAAIYCLTLACRLVSEPAGHAGPPGRGPALRIAGLMILIVDDDLAVTASLALLLKQAGFASLAAARRTRR